MNVHVLPVGSEQVDPWSRFFDGSQQAQAADTSNTDTTDTADTAEKWVTSQELVARGISESAQRRGRISGQLKYSSLGNGSYAYRQKHVDAWLAGSNGKHTARQAPPITRRPSGIPPVTPRRSSATGSTTPTSALEEWNVVVAEAMRSRRLSREEAYRLCQAAHPAEYKAALAAVGNRVITMI